MANSIALATIYFYRTDNEGAQEWVVVTLITRAPLFFSFDQKPRQLLQRLRLFTKPIQFRKRCVH